LIKKKNYDMSGFLQPVYKYGEGIAGQKGVRYGIPLTAGVAFVIYRTDLIKGNVPPTWSGYFDALKQNTGGGRYGSSFAGVPAQLVKLFLARYWSEGDPLLTPDWKPLINGPKGVKALNMLAEQTSKYAPPGILAWDNPDAANAFTRGQVSIYEGWGSFIFPALNDPTKSQVANKWSIGLYPENGTGNFVQHNFVIFKRSQNPEAAFDFIAYATSPQKEKEILVKFKDIPARKTVYTDPEVVAKVPYVTKMALALDRGRPFAPGVPYWLEMFIGLGDGLSTALSAKASPQQALNDVADKWTRLTRQNPLKFEYRE
jgi:multiple sugar transport system substrate-binding protein